MGLTVMCADMLQQAMQSSTYQLFDESLVCFNCILSAHLCAACLLTQLLLQHPALLTQRSNPKQAGLAEIEQQHCGQSSQKLQRLAG